MNKLIFVGMASLVSIHFLITGLYLLPINPISSSLNGIIHSYVDPLFDQNWRLFAPNPSTVSRKLLIRCQKRDLSWSSWYDPIASHQQKNFENRMSYHGKISYVFMSVATQLKTELVMHAEKQGCKVLDKKCLSKSLADLNHSSIVTTAKRFGVDVCSQIGQLESINVEYALTEVYPKKYSERLMKKNFSKIEYTRLPTISLASNKGVKI